jgi:hypothetical protein
MPRPVRDRGYQADWLLIDRGETAQAVVSARMANGAERAHAHLNPRAVGPPPSLGPWRATRVTRRVTLRIACVLQGVTFTLAR